MYKVNGLNCANRALALAEAASAAIAGVKGMASRHAANEFAAELLSAAESSGGTAQLEFSGSAFGRGRNPSGSLSCDVEITVYMDSYTEMHHLQQRSKELRTIVANLEDIKDWMAKNTVDMQSGLLECVTQLESAIDRVDSVKAMVDEKATEMEAQVYAENVTE